MEETRKFLRYVLPGLIILPEMIFIFYLNGEICLLRKYFDIGSAIIGLLASGIIGFLFSNLYYPVYWEIYMRQRRIKRISFVDLIEDNPYLFKAFKVDIGKGSKSHAENGEVDPKEINNRHLMTEKEAWPIINAFFNLKYNGKFSYVDKKSGSMSIVLSSMGTTILVVFIFSIVSVFSIISCCDRVIYIGVNIVVLSVLCWNYQLTAGILNNLFKRYIEWIKDNPE
jgi:hypothetical protein